MVCSARADVLCVVDDKTALAVLCGAIEWAGAGRQLALVPAGSRCCKLHAARWQIGSGDGAVRTCLSSNWAAQGSSMRWLSVSRRQWGLGVGRLFTCTGSNAAKDGCTR